MLLYAGNRNLAQNLDLLVSCINQFKFLALHYFLGNVAQSAPNVIINPSISLTSIRGSL